MPTIRGALACREVRCLRPMLLATSMRVCRGSYRRGRSIIETFRPFANEAASNEAFNVTQRRAVVRSGEANGIADCMRAASAPNAMYVILGMHRKIVIHYV